MANATVKKILQEGPRNAVVKLTGLLDTSDVTLISAIALTDFTNNDPNLVLTGFRVDVIEYSMSDNAKVNLYWNATAPEPIALLAGRFRFNSRCYGGNTPTTANPGYDGTINLITLGWTVSTNYTVILELVKLYRAR